jgi:predicted Zn-dependent protease
VLPTLAAALLGACASTAPGGRSQLAVPEPISSLYSTIDLNLTLASLATVTTSCEGIQCQVDKGFERQVVRLGTRLAEAAYEAHPELKERIPKFNFIVAEKIEGGSSSDASGTIVIYRGVRKAPLDEVTLACLIAGEMGHVIARHHDEKSAAAVLSSLLAQILLAPANLARGVAFLASSTVTAVGKNIVAGSATQERLKESDTIALDLLNRQGWSGMEITDSLLDYSNRLGKDAWSEDVKRTAMRLGNYKSADELALVQSPSF